MCLGVTLKNENGIVTEIRRFIKGNRAYYLHEFYSDHDWIQKCKNEVIKHRHVNVNLLRDLREKYQTNIK